MYPSAFSRSRTSGGTSAGGAAFAVADAWSFDDLNELIEQHNDWYPIERQLPMDPRTRDYVRFAGRSYRRPVLDTAWVLQHFPPRPR